MLYFFYNNYIDMQTQNIPPFHTKTGSPPYNEDFKLDVPLKYYPKTTGNKADWTKYRRICLATLGVNDRSHFIDKLFKVSDAIGVPT